MNKFDKRKLAMIVLLLGEEEEERNRNKRKREETKKRKSEDIISNRLNEGETSSNAGKFSVIAIDNNETTIKDWILKLNKMSYQQRILANKFIMDILLGGEKGCLREDSVKINVGRGRFQFGNQSDDQLLMPPETQSMPRQSNLTSNAIFLPSVSASNPLAVVKEEIIDSDRLSSEELSESGSHLDIDIEPVEYHNVKQEADDSEEENSLRRTENPILSPPPLNKISKESNNSDQIDSFAGSKIEKNDEFYSIGLKIAAKLKKINQIDPRHRHFCEKMINDTLFVGLMQQKINFQMQMQGVS